MPLSPSKSRTAMSAAATLLVSFFLLLLLLFLLPEFCFSCRVVDFTCGDNSSDTTARLCGSHHMRCLNSNLQIQFAGKGPWYVVEEITYPEKRIRVRNGNLGAQLPRNCHFVYNFTSPITAFYPSSITTLNTSATIFNCSGNSYDFSNDVFEKYQQSGYCSSYDLYYSHRPEAIPPLDRRCWVSKEDIVEWEMSYHENGESGSVDFSLLSFGYSRGRRFSSECFECQMKSGFCSPVSSLDPYTCSCNHKCTFGGTLSTPKKALIGVCASVVGLVFLVASCWVVLRYSRRNTKKRSSSQSTSLVRCIFSGSSKSDNQNSTYSETHIFSYKELEEATDGFSPAKEIGDGGFGVVYKGILGDGRTVAVKRPYENNFRRVEQFMNEIAILKHIRHPNLVSLFGCTDRDSQQLLVYEFVPNGTVADHLDGPRAAEGGGRLTWSVRMNIAVEIADALSYLHSFVPQIIHRDVKTNNILLDNDYHVKVADFGLSRLFPLDVTHVSTAPQGTPGYVDPEYYQCYQLTDKSDVFSFGVVLVELISSKPAVDIKRSRQEINLSNMAMNRISNGLVHELADPMLGYETDPEVRRTIEQVAEVAFLCLQADKDMRPPMKDVKGKLVDIVNDSKQRAVDGRMLTSCSTITLSTADTATLDWHTSSCDSIPKTDA